MSTPAPPHSHFPTFAAAGRVVARPTGWLLPRSLAVLERIVLRLVLYAVFLLSGTNSVIGRLSFPYMSSNGYQWRGMPDDSLAAFLYKLTSFFINPQYAELIAVVALVGLVCSTAREQPVYAPLSGSAGL
jgi:hypothetical protein